MRNEIDQRTKYPYHSYPLIQMNGLHTRILEFMTDIHPIKDEKDALEIDSDAYEDLAGKITI